MKKMFVGLLLVAAVLMTGVVPALATLQPNGDNYFDFQTIICTEGAERELNRDWTYGKTSNIGKLYVQQYIYTPSGEAPLHTNMFRAARDDTPTTLRGGKWMIPNGSYYVEADGIIAGRLYKTWARGNTNYGLGSTLTVVGHCNANK